MRVVDDSDDIREVVSFVLSGRGYRVVEAENGQAALEMAQKECPDLILMDLSMPVLDGFGAVRGIRQITEMCDVPIVAISAHNTVDHRTKALVVGFNDYLTKPIDLFRLMTLIQSLLSIA